jgi:5'(3')-deoxyribonucleotidase
MKRLIVDMDDVLADATGQFIDYYEKEFGLRVERAVLDGKDGVEGFPDNHSKLREFVFRPNFFRTMRVNANSQHVLKELNKKYEVFIVSAAIEFPLSLPEKLEWLKEHFPFLTWQQIVFCGSKTVVHGDFMIDDLPRNLERFNGEKFIFTAPHNKHYHQFQRLNNWEEVEKKLL